MLCFKWNRVTKPHNYNWLSLIFIRNYSAGWHLSQGEKSKYLCPETEPCKRKTTEMKQTCGWYRSCPSKYNFLQWEVCKVLLEGQLVQPLVQSRFSQIRMLMALSIQSLNIFEDGDFKTSLSSLHHLSSPLWSSLRLLPKTELDLT